MIDPNTQASCLIAWSWICFMTLIEQLHPGSASGASFGCFFLLAFPDPSRDRWYELACRKIGLLVFSWGIGYGAGSGHAAGGGNYAILISCSSSALAAAVFGALNLMVRNDGPLPKWLSAIVDRIPTLKGGNDGQ